MKILNKIKEISIDLFKSLYKTMDLFKFCIHNWITPLLIFILICAVMVVPTINTYNSIKLEDITKNVSYLDKVVAHVLSNDVKCSINDSKLTCDEGYSYREVYEFKNNNDDTIKYNIFINTSVSDIDFSVGSFGEHFDTDNYLIFFETTFTYRYAYHNPQTETVNEYKLYGFYDNLNGINLHDVYTTSLQQEDSQAYLLSQGQNIIVEGYKAVASELILTTLVSNIGLYILFMLVVALLLKGNFLLKRKKGFKYSQALKIAIIGSLQSVLIALVLSLFNMNFSDMFGLAICVRMLYIYIRYTGSKKNTKWIEDLYELTKDERFNIN